MTKRLPKFKSEKEQADFWATHSPLNYPNEFKEVKDLSQFRPVLPSATVNVWDYQKKELNEIKKSYNDRLINDADVIGHLLRVYKVSKEYYRKENKGV